VRILAGTYTLVGNLLTIFFTQAQSNDPADVVQVPSTQKVVEVSIRRGTLTVVESDGTRFYTAL
tara:strand:+ start:81 stop:272 length:192 start_codon:yes stop_codon:yes gene_type:complete